MRLNGPTSSVRTAEKIMEISHICIHGCPDCISLNTKSLAGQYKERYVINKYLVDLVLARKLSEISLDESASIKVVDDMLKRKGVARLTARRPNQNESRIEDLVTQLHGKKIRDGVVKLSGRWINCAIQAEPHVEISYLVSLV